MHVHANIVITHCSNLSYRQTKWRESLECQDAKYTVRLIARNFLKNGSKRAETDKLR